MSDGTRIPRDVASEINPLIDVVAIGTLGNVATLLEDLGAAMETLDSSKERFGSSAGLIHRIASSALRFEAQAMAGTRTASNVVALGVCHG